MMSGWNKRSALGGLIMTRGVGEMIKVNNGEIIIEIVEIRGKYVRLAFKANKEIQIARMVPTKGDQNED